MKKAKTTKVLSFQATTELYGKIKVYAMLNNLTLSEAIIELIKIALGSLLK